eukprot:1149076-Pelagomonas_calceolata.AAC.4
MQGAAHRFTRHMWIAHALGQVHCAGSRTSLAQRTQPKSHSPACCRAPTAGSGAVDGAVGPQQSRAGAVQSVHCRRPIVAVGPLRAHCRGQVSAGSSAVHPLQRAVQFECLPALQEEERLVAE